MNDFHLNLAMTDLYVDILKYGQACADYATQVSYTESLTDKRETIKKKLFSLGVAPELSSSQKHLCGCKNQDHHNVCKRTHTCQGYNSLK